jgi:hypothetical protein
MMSLLHLLTVIGCENSGNQNKFGDYKLGHVVIHFQIFVLRLSPGLVLPPPTLHFRLGYVRFS